MRRGEIWIADVEPKARPVVLVSRDSHLRARELILVVPVTTVVRGVENEVALGAADGLLRPCVADAGSIRLLPKSALTKLVAALSRRQREKLDAALRFSLGLDG